MVLFLYVHSFYLVSYYFRILSFQWFFNKHYMVFFRLCYDFYLLGYPSSCLSYLHTFPVVIVSSVKISPLPISSTPWPPLFSLAVIHEVTQFMSIRTTVQWFLKCTKVNLYILKISMWELTVRKELKQISSLRRLFHRL